MATDEKFFTRNSLKRRKASSSARILLFLREGGSRIMTLGSKPASAPFGCRKLPRTRKLARNLVGRIPEHRAGSLGRLPALGLVALTLALSGCLNLMQNPLRPSKTAVTIENNLFNNQAPTIVIGAALRTQVNPEASIDVLGWHATTSWNTEGTEALPLPVSSPLPGSTGAERIRAFCTPSEDSRDKNFGCSCVFRTGTTEQAVVPLYYESDLVRCPIPEALRLSSFLLYLNRADTGQISNALRVEMTPQASVNDPLFYSKVTRYACRQAAFVSHMMGPIIDPFQTESPANARTFLHYTTNFGRALALFASPPANEQQQDYLQEDIHCPPHLDSTKVSLALALRRGANETTISDVQGGVPNSVEDHVNFRLAKSPAAPFNVRVLISQAPGIAPESKVLPQLGFAALPTAGGGCPDTPLPSNMRWRKLWLFRSEASNRKFRVSESWSRLRHFHMGCTPRPNDRFTQTTPEKKFITGSGASLGERSYRPNNFFLRHDCGSEETVNSTPIAGLTCDLGETDSWSPPTTRARILLPTDAMNNYLGEDIRGEYHRCLRMDDLGSVMRDRCTRSRFSCSQNFTRNPDGVCKGNGNPNLKNQFTEREGISIREQPTSQQYLFLVTDPSLSVEEVRNWTLEQPNGEEGNAYTLTTNPADIPGQTNYPLCVPQLTGGVP